MKTLIFLLIVLGLHGCASKQKETLSEEDAKIAEREGLFETEAGKNMKDSTILLGIKLQSTEEEYLSKICQLHKSGKINKISGRYYYTFNFNSQKTVRAKGFLKPVFRKNRLFKLEISIEWGNVNPYFSDTVLFSLLDDLYRAKYKDFENVMLFVPESRIYEHDWYGDGKHVSLSGSDIFYSCAKEENTYYEELIKADKKNSQKHLDDI